MAKLEKFNLPQYGSFTTDAAMQEFFVEYTTFFEDNGFIRTSDTGQFDPATAAGTGTFYEIRKFTGDHSSTSPIFVRFAWTNRCVSVTITFGTGSNGSGTLTGGWGSISNTSSNITSSSVGGLMLSTKPGEFVTFSQQNSAFQGTAFTVGRSINANTGAVTDNFAYMIGRSTGGASSDTSNSAVCDYTSGNSNSTTASHIYAFFDLGLTSSPKAIEVILLHRTWFNTTAPTPFPHAVVGFNSEWPLATKTTLTNVGPDPMTYRSLGRLGNSSTPANYALLGRWD